MSLRGRRMPLVVGLALALALLPAAPAAAEFVSHARHVRDDQRPGLFAIAQARRRDLHRRPVHARRRSHRQRRQTSARATEHPTSSFARPNGSAVHWRWRLRQRGRLVHRRVVHDARQRRRATASPTCSRAAPSTPASTPALTGTDQSVDALAVSGSDGLYVAGGSFTSVNAGAPPKHLAAFDTTNRHWRHRLRSRIASPRSVYALAERPGRRCTCPAATSQSVGSPAVTRNLVAAFDTATSGLPTAFDQLTSASPAGPATTSLGIGPPSPCARARDRRHEGRSTRPATSRRSTARRRPRQPRGVRPDDLIGTATAFHPTTQPSSTIGALAAWPARRRLRRRELQHGPRTRRASATENFLAAFDGTTGAATTPDAFDTAPNGTWSRGDRRRRARRGLRRR